VYASNSTFQVAGLKANLAITLLDAHVVNLDSFGKSLTLMDPIPGKPNELNTTFAIGPDSRDLGIATKLLLSLSDGKGLNLQNEVAIRLDLSAVSVVVELLVQILEEPFFSVPLKNTLMVNCWIATVLPSSSLGGEILMVRHEVAVESLFVNFTCVTCSSPNFDELAFDIFSTDGSGDATATFLNLVNRLKGSQYLENLNPEVSKMAAKQCPYSPEYDPSASYRDLFVTGEAGSVLVEPDRDKRAQFFNVASAVIAICVTITYFVVRRIIDRKLSAWKASLSGDNLRQLHLKEKADKDDEEELNKSTESMYRSPVLLPRERYGFPVVLVLTIGLQLCGHLALLSSVTLSGQIAGEPFVVRGFLEFSFFKALRRAGDNGGFEMALLAFIFTGIWPYVKLVASICLWFAPPQKLSVSRRGSVLLWLDVFAKLSVVDIVTILFAVGAFIVYFGGLDNSLQADGQFFALKAIVQVRSDRGTGGLVDFPSNHFVLLSSLVLAATQS